jgi:hypothetical protein
LGISFPPGPTRQPLLSLPARLGLRVSPSPRLPRASAPARWPAARRALLRCPPVGQRGPGRDLPHAPACSRSPPRSNAAVAFSQTLARLFFFLPPPLPLPLAHCPPHSVAVGEPPSNPSRPHHLLPLLVRLRPLAAFPSARSSSPTRSSVRRRRSPPRPARPCCGRPPPLRRAARARAAPAYSRPLPPFRLLAAAASRHARARPRAGRTAGVRWPRPWRVKATAGLDFAWAARWPPGPACRRPRALDPGGSSACRLFFLFVISC